ncbi:MAG: hypothetical protein ACMXYC_04445 [Candidatus Woesearchaeota archaeon]
MGIMGLFKKKDKELDLPPPPPPSEAKDTVNSSPNDTLDAGLPDLPDLELPDAPSASDTQQTGKQEDHLPDLPDLDGAGSNAGDMHDDLSLPDFPDLDEHVDAPSVETSSHQDSAPSPQDVSVEGQDEQEDISVPSFSDMSEEVEVPSIEQKSYPSMQVGKKGPLFVNVDEYVLVHDHLDQGAEDLEHIFEYYNSVKSLVGSQNTLYKKQETTLMAIHKQLMEIEKKIFDR